MQGREVRKSMLLLLVLQSILACNTQKQFIENDIFCEFDQEIFEGEKKIMISKSMIDSIQKFGEIEVSNSTDINVKLYNFPSKDVILMKWIHNKKTKIDKVLEYNQDGDLVNSSFFFQEKLPIGKFLNYKSDGGIVEIDNYRQINNYPICFKEAMDIVEKKLPKKDTIFGIEREKRITKKKDSLYFWKVYVDEINNKPSRTIWIYKVDAATGKIFKKVRSIPDMH